MQTIYSRYSRSRRPEYQIATFIEVDGAYNVVRKKALTPVARPHILRMISNYQVLCDIYGKEHVAAVQMEDEDTVRFDFVEGVSWGAWIADIGYHQGKQEFFSELRQYYHFLEEGKTTNWIFLYAPLLLEWWILICTLTTFYIRHMDLSLLIMNGFIRMHLFRLSSKGR